MLRLPYGTCDFQKIIMEDYFYVDRTAKIRLTGYGSVLANAYGDKLRLRSYSVVALGFERLVWEEVTDNLKNHSLVQ